MGLPDTFWWGTAASSLHSEGAAPASDWYAGELQGRVPVSGTGAAVATHFATDCALYAAHGLSRHRLTLEWSRVEPEPGSRDPRAVERYRSMLHTLRDAGLRAWVCLHHGPLPAWFVARGGFADDDNRKRWSDHVTWCADTLDGLVEGWQPLHDPVGWAMATTSTPGPHGPRRDDTFARALRGAFLAWRDAWRRLAGRGAVATSIELAPLLPADDTPAAGSAQQRADDLMWGVWMRALREGVLALPGRPVERIEDLEGSCDLVGISYFHAAAIAADGSHGPFPAAGRVSATGTVPWSEGLGLVIARVRGELPGLPMVVTHGVATDDDEWRCSLLHDAVAQVEAMVGFGADVRGFLYWTGVDGYDPAIGPAAPLGLFTTERIAKRSADVLAGYARA